MSLLIKLNDIRPQIEDIRNDIENAILGEEADTIMNVIDELSAALTRSIQVIQKHYNDERTLDLMEKDLEKRIAEESIYDGIPDDKKDEIIEKIIASPDVQLIDSEELKEYILTQLKELATDELVTKAYSKQDIINLGESVTEDDISETRKYDAGINVLRDMVETPNGRDDALTFGLKRMMSDAASRLHYIYLYYNIG